MPTNPPDPEAGTDPLAAARDAIDALDDQLLDLIERRFALSRQVATLKQDDDSHLKLRPRREAAIVARLTARATSATPQLIAQVWRELMAHSLQAQVRTEIHLWAGAAADAELRDQLRARFGRAAPLVAAASPDSALDRALGGQAVAAVELGDGGWWTRLGREPSLRVFDTLDGGESLALLVGRVADPDIAAGRALRVTDRPDGRTVLARHAGLCLVRDSGQEAAQ